MSKTEFNSILEKCGLQDIAKQITDNQDTIQIIRGPRQCGKTSLLLHIDPSFNEISLDDHTFRELANRDPELFLSQFNTEKIFKRLHW
ncbi:hypothetical protein EHQ55_14675 [Leptospira meyeri]|uniref:AAA family ATPase n=1 Tax=Leptospira meyeri TaxID=29508 RepID=UPI0010839A1E|nr:AAA family ATPase [Leptospira meyeri]TGL47062.1 hypothetical protein EHQ55_14675 [Leptospira meyeri]